MAGDAGQHISYSMLSLGRVQKEIRVCLVIESLLEFVEVTHMFCGERRPDILKFSKSPVGREGRAAPDSGRPWCPIRPDRRARHIGRSNVEEDDIIDAVAMLVTARRISLGHETVLPEGCVCRDRRGLRMEILA